MSKQTQYNPGKIKPIVNIVCSLIKTNPALLDERDLLMANLYNQIPELKKREKCANCDASMIEYIFEFDILDALLLYGMANQVSRRQYEQDMTFTEANKINVQKLPPAITYAMKSRTTQCSKLGLIAKLKGEKGWVITNRGWKAIRNEPVPRYVRVWRKQIIERTDELITIQDIFSQHKSKVEESIQRHKQPKSDYRHLVETYDPYSWVKFGGVHEGKLL